MITSTGDYKNQSHLESLKEGYELVGNETWKLDDLESSSIQSSRNFFTDESLDDRIPVPQKLEVYALLSGISFSKPFSDRLNIFRKDIKEILGDKLHYLVLPENLGVEHCVFKWPEESWNEDWKECIIDTISSLNIPAFDYHIFGIQLNKDGCIVAKGYDENRAIFNLRKTLRDNLEFLPERQSNWAHVPIGRILEPLGHRIFEELKEYFSQNSFSHFSTEKINSIKFVYETQWYMEEKSILKEFNLES